MVSYDQQESIPVGCVSSAFVVPEEYDLGGMVPVGYNPTLAVDGLTRACGNITFPQLRWRAVIKSLAH